MSHVAPPGVIILGCVFGAVTGLLAADGRFTDVADHLDLAGRPRYVTARRA
jgi:hypothetical protein